MAKPNLVQGHRNPRRIQGPQAEKKAIMKSLCKKSVNLVFARCATDLSVLPDGSRFERMGIGEEVAVCSSVPSHASKQGHWGDADSEANKQEQDAQGNNG